MGTEQQAQPVGDRRADRHLQRGPIRQVDERDRGEAEQRHARQRAMTPRRVHRGPGARQGRVGGQQQHEVVRPGEGRQQDGCRDSHAQFAIRARLRRPPPPPEDRQRPGQQQRVCRAGDRAQVGDAQHEAVEGDVLRSRVPIDRPQRDEPVPVGPDAEHGDGDERREPARRARRDESTPAVAREVERQDGQQEGLAEDEQAQQRAAPDPAPAPVQQPRHDQQQRQRGGRLPACERLPTAGQDGAGERHHGPAPRRAGGAQGQREGQRPARRHQRQPGPVRGFDGQPCERGHRQHQGRGVQVGEGEGVATDRDRRRPVVGRATLAHLHGRLPEEAEVEAGMPRVADQGNILAQRGEDEHCDQQVVGQATQGHWRSLFSGLT